MAFSKSPAVSLKNRINKPFESIEKKLKKIQQEFVDSFTEYTTLPKDSFNTPLTVGIQSTIDDKVLIAGSQADREKVLIYDLRNKSFNQLTYEYEKHSSVPSIIAKKADEKSSAVNGIAITHITHNNIVHGNTRDNEQIMFSLKKGMESPMLLASNNSYIPNILDLEMLNETHFIYGPASISGDISTHILHRNDLQEVFNKTRLPLSVKIPNAAAIKQLVILEMNHFVVLSEQEKLEMISTTISKMDAYKFNEKPAKLEDACKHLDGVTINSDMSYILKFDSHSVLTCHSDAFLPRIFFNVIDFNNRESQNAYAINDCNYEIEYAIKRDDGVVLLSAHKICDGSDFFSPNQYTPRKILAINFQDHIFYEVTNSNCMPCFSLLSNNRIAYICETSKNEKSEKKMAIANVENPANITREKMESELKKSLGNHPVNIKEMCSIITDYTGYGSHLKKLSVFNNHIGIRTFPALTQQSSDTPIPRRKTI